MATVIRGSDNFDTSPTVASNVPAFSAKPTTGQDVPNSTWTKVILGTELFDTDSKFADSKFTPTVAGKYQLSCAVVYGDSAGTPQLRLAIHKNGSQLVATTNEYNSTAGYGAVNLSYLAEANTTDYFEIYTYQNRGQATMMYASTTYFTAFKLAGV